MSIGFAIVVLFVEQHTGRHSSRPRNRGKLHEPAVLEQQVSRMFADPRARASLVQNFFSDWLQTRNVWLLNPDGTKFPIFDDNLRSAFVTETEMFLDAQLKEDHASVADLLTSNETFLNEQLAHHYGIPGVYGSHFRRVNSPMRTALGCWARPACWRSPLIQRVLRRPSEESGCWKISWPRRLPRLRPTCHSLESSNKDGKPLSVRQMLELHRANPACASCHARMDPLGLSLENFDAIGQWRTTDAGHAIDASGVLLDGTKVDGPRELRLALVAQKTQFVNAVTDKLLTYALGRGLEYYDAPTVRAIDRSAAADGLPLVIHYFRDCEERALSDENRWIGQPSRR
jgi:hypothetical protein